MLSPFKAAPPAPDETPHLRRLDLNLLLTFDALMKTHSATAAARLLHKTQPAVSRDLARLRERLSDPLMVLTKGRLAPTERALEIHAVVRESLQRIESTLTPATAFDPSMAAGAIRIGTGAHLEVLIAAPLLAVVKQEAPDVTIRFESMHGNFDPDDLDNERIDIAVGVFENVAPRFPCEHLFDDQRVCVVSTNHPFAHRKRLTLDNLSQLDWFAFTHMHGRETTFDRVLRPLHRKMVFSAYLSGFGITPHVLLNTRFATTMPACVARLHQQHFPIATLGMPPPLSTIRISMSWPRRQQTSPLHQWMREKLRVLIAQHVKKKSLVCPSCTKTPWSPEG